MKNILEAPFMKELCRCISNMYRLGYDERNGGNISYLLKQEDLEEYLDLSKVVREIPMGFEAKPLIGKYFIVTATGSYFRNVEHDPEDNLGIIRVKDDGVTAELMWGYADGGQFTSELPAHLMAHMVRLEKDPESRVVTHCHPNNILAMTYVLPIDDKIFTRELWQMETECMVIFPEGVGVLPWMLCGTNSIGEATAQKMADDYRIVVWAQHGIYGCGKTLDEAFGLIETVEKAATIYMMTAGFKRINTITDDNLRQIAKRYGVTPREGFLED